MAKIKKLSKKTRLAIAITLVSMLMLLLVTPSVATNVNLGGPGSVLRGTNLDFWVQIDIYECEQVPIEYICVDIDGPSVGSAHVKFNPKGEIIHQSGGFEILSAIFPMPKWGYTYCDHNWGYGYIYGGYHYPTGYRCPCTGYIECGEITREQAHDYKLMGQHFGPGWGYGYGQYGWGGECYPGVVTLSYEISWDTSMETLGMYYANAYTGVPEFNKWYRFMSTEPAPEQVEQFLDNFGFISCGFQNASPYPFEIRAGGGGGGGGGGGEEEVGEVPEGFTAENPNDPCCLDLGGLVDAGGFTTTDITLTCDACDFVLVIPAGTAMLDADGNPIGEVCFEILHTPPVPEGWAMVGNAIEFEPSGATFDPPLNATFYYSQADVPGEASESDIIMAYWDGAQLLNLNTTVNT